MSCFMCLINLVRVSNKSKFVEKINGEYYTVCIMEIKPLWPASQCWYYPRVPASLVLTYSYTQ
jgi:hypothetical protein